MTYNVFGGTLNLALSLWFHIRKAQYTLLMFMAHVHGPCSQAMNTDV